MKRLAAPLLVGTLALLLASCGSSPDKKMLGHWASANPGAANVPGGAPTLDITETEIIQREMGTMTFKYKVLKVEGNDVTIDADDGFGKPQQFVATVNGDALTFERAKNRNPVLGGTDWKRN